GPNGDTGRLVAWATAILHGRGDPMPIYPPLSLYGLAGLAKVFYAGNVAYAFKGMEILGAAVIGPLAYLAWQMLFRPMWALVIGVVPMMALIDSYKPYDAVGLILLPPVPAALLRAGRPARARGRGRRARGGWRAGTRSFCCAAPAPRTGTSASTSTPTRRTSRCGVPTCRAWSPSGRRPGR